MSAQGCPGSRVMEFDAAAAAGSTGAEVPSQLRQWPIQLKLVPPTAPYFRGADVVLAADCVAYAVGGFHSDHLAGKALSIACPKLDEGQEAYVEKLRAMVDEGGINTFTVMIMQVPCCSGLLAMATKAVAAARRKVPIKSMVVGLQGQVLKQEWVAA